MIIRKNSCIVLNNPILDRHHRTGRVGTEYSLNDSVIDKRGSGRQRAIAQVEREAVSYRIDNALVVNGATHYQNHACTLNGMTDLLCERAININFARKLRVITKHYFPAALK